MIEMEVKLNILVILLLGATCLLARDWQASKYAFPWHWCLEMGREHSVRPAAFLPWREWSSTSLETTAHPRSSEMEEWATTEHETLFQTRKAFAPSIFNPHISEYVR